MDAKLRMVLVLEFCEEVSVVLDAFSFGHHLDLVKSEIFQSWLEKIPVTSSLKQAVPTPWDGCREVTAPRAAAPHLRKDLHNFKAVLQA